jgi:hypothetical protein
MDLGSSGFGLQLGFSTGLDFSLDFSNGFGFSGLDFSLVFLQDTDRMFFMDG